MALAKTIAASQHKRWRKYIFQVFDTDHREHTLLLNRKEVNKGIKRTNSQPLSPVVLTRSYCRENRYLQVLRSNVALNSYLGFSALWRNVFLFYVYNYVVVS